MITFKNAERLYSKFTVCIYAAVFLFWLWVFYNTPYFHDDWVWGIPSGFQDLITGCENSRHVGNSCIVLITRSPVFKTLFTSVLVWALCFGISIFPAGLSKSHRLLIFLFSNLMFFLADSHVWQESFGWLSGFANYVTSAFSMVVLYLVIRKNFTSPENASKKSALLIFLFTFASSLFVEHLTIYFFIFSTAAFIHSIYVKKCSRNIVSMLSAVVLGSAVMFTGPSYSGMLQTGGDGVRVFVTKGAEKSLSAITEAIFSRLSYHMYQMYEVNAYICIVVLVILTVLLIHELKGKRLLSLSFSAYNILLCIRLFLQKTQIIIPQSLYACIYAASARHYLNIVFPLVTFVELFLLVMLGRKKQTFLNLAFIWLSTFITVLPLACTTTHGARLYFFAIVLASLFAAESYAYMVEQGIIKAKSFSVLLAVVSVACLLFFAHAANTYRVIGNVNHEQMELIRQAKQNQDSVIVLPEYYQKHKRYVYVYGAYGPYIGYFKEFYDIDPSVYVDYFYRD